MMNPFLIAMLVVLCLGALLAAWDDWTRNCAMRHVFRELALAVTAGGAALWALIA